MTTDANGAKISEMRHCEASRRDKACPYRVLRKGEVRYTWTNAPANTSPAYSMTKYQFTGQYSYAAEFGLLYYGARFYDPALGRFSSADSITPDGVHGYDRYNYVNNRPTANIDPTGHSPLEPDQNSQENSTNCEDSSSGDGTVLNDTTVPLPINGSLQIVAGTIKRGNLLDLANTISDEYAAANDPHNEDPQGLPADYKKAKDGAKGANAVSGFLLGVGTGFISCLSTVEPAAAVVGGGAPGLTVGGIGCIVAVAAFGTGMGVGMDAVAERDFGLGDLLQAQGSFHNVGSKKGTNPNDEILITVQDGPGSPMTMQIYDGYEITTLTVDNYNNEIAPYLNGNLCSTGLE